jgi:hypothetical protein
MHISLKGKNSGDIEFGIIYGSIAVMALLAARYLPISNMLPACTFKAVTGIPCPTCGTTRSLMYLAYGDITGSLIMNPLFSLAMISASILLLVRLTCLSFSHTRITLTHTRREGTLLRAGMVGIFLANWIYLMVCL